MKKEITFDRFVRILGALIIIALIYLLLNKLSNVLMPFFVAWLIAYLLYPIVTFFQYKCKLKYRLLSIIVTLVLILGTIYGIGLLIITDIVHRGGAVDIHCLIVVSALHQQIGAHQVQTVVIVA